MMWRSAFGLTFLILGIACEPPVRAPARPVPHIDTKVFAASVFGLQVGMSPRRVMLEIRWAISPTV